MSESHFYIDQKGLLAKMQEIYGEPNGAWPKSTLEVPIERAKLRIKLILEELGEAIEGYKTNDVPEIVDGLCDSLVVVLGGFCLYGISYDMRNAEYIMTNPTVLAELVNPAKQLELLELLHREFGQAEREIEEIMFESISETAKQMRINNIVAETVQYVGTTFLGFFAVMSIAERGWHLNENFNRIMDSNFAKLCETETEAQETCQSYATNKGWPCHYNTVEVDGKSKYLIKRTADGKTMKSINWKEHTLLLD